MRGVMFATVAVAVIGTATLSACSGSIHLTAPVSGAPATATPPLGHATALPLDGRTQAELNIVTGFSSVTITTQAIGNDLIRVATEPGSPVALLTDQGNTVTIAGGGQSNAAIQIVLNPSPQWQVALDGGASTANVDLTGAHLGPITVGQGISSLTVALPAQPGTTRLTLAAGVSSLSVDARGNEPVRATFALGAGSALIDGVAHSGIAAASSFAESDWATATNRVDIECAAGIGNLTVTHT